MKKIMMTLAAVLCCAMATVFTSCSKSNDSDGDDKPSSNVVTVLYRFTVGQAYIDYFDVHCIFTDINGNVNDYLCTGPANEYYDVVAYDKAPQNYEFSVIAYPKANHPAIDPEGKYDVSCNYVTGVNVRTSADAQGTLKIIMGKSYTETKQVKGSRLATMLEEGEQVIIPKITGTK